MPLLFALALCQSCATKPRKEKPPVVSTQDMKVESEKLQARINEIELALRDAKGKAEIIKLKAELLEALEGQE